MVSKKEKVADINKALKRAGSKAGTGALWCGAFGVVCSVGCTVFYATPTGVDD